MVRQVVNKQREAALLKQQAGRLSAPETFIQAAKLQRRAIALEKEVQQLSSMQVSPTMLGWPRPDHTRIWN